MRLLLMIWLVAVATLGLLLWLLTLVQSGIELARRARWRRLDEQPMIGRPQSL